MRRKGIHVHVGDCRQVLKTLPPSFVRCCVTSPPYWGLRAYGDVLGQVGVEPNFDDYVNNLVEVFDEVRRVLRDDGTLWLNLGDTRVKKGAYYWSSDDHHHGRKMAARPKPPHGLKSKDMVGIPWKVAFALRDRGWYLREEVIWEKPNAKPESVKDRPTRSHEHLFFFSKSELYFYDSAAAREPASWIVDANGKRKADNATRNWRTVWNITTTKSDHPAAFPIELPKRCILASSAKGNVVLDPFAGSGTTGKAAEELGRSALLIEAYEEYAKESIRPGWTLHSSTDSSPAKT